MRSATITYGVGAGSQAKGCKLELNVAPIFQELSMEPETEHNLVIIT